MALSYDQALGCSYPAGSINVRNVAFDAGGSMTGLYATYTVTCEGGTAAFRGTIHAGL